MNDCPRIIARLDLKGKNLIKGIRYEGLSVIGEAIDYAMKYYLDNADEIIYVDSVASLYGRNSLFTIIQQSTNEIFIPVSVGGGISTIDDVKNLLNSGADKIVLNKAAIENPSLIENISNQIGSQSLVISVQAKKRGINKWEAFKICGREPTGWDVIEWCAEIEKRGAGEIFLTSIDNDGTESGFDIDLIKAVTEKVSIPVIASGGCGSVDDIIELLKKANPSGIAIGTLIHYGYETIKSIKKKLKNAL